jgi:DNA-binding HxlR family transcriptional regulator
METTAFCFHPRHADESTTRPLLLIGKDRFVGSVPVRMTLDVHCARTGLSMDRHSPLPPAEIFDEAFFSVARECTVEAWLYFLGHRWNALILYHLSEGPKRFTEISACLPDATAKVLTERLSALQRYELIERPGGRGEAYRLTERGGALMPLLFELEVWSRELPRIQMPG